MDNNDITLKGTIEKIIYRNENNGYTVAVLYTPAGSETITGSFPFVNEGESVEVSGNYTDHSVYGTQFSVNKLKVSGIVSKAAVLKYLSSGIIKGVGPATAVKIVERFGENTLKVIENTPEDLSLISGISKEKAIKIGEEYKKRYGIKDLMMTLSPYSFSMDRCVKIYKTLGENCAEIIKQNPYVLCGEDLGVSFETAERIAYDNGIDKDSEKRLSAGVEYIITSNTANGHTSLPREKIIPVAVNMLESDYNRIDGICDRLISGLRINSFIMDGKEFLALPKYYNSERYIAAKLISMANSTEYKTDIDELEIDYVENKLDIKFHDNQRKAVKMAFVNNIMILTGGPGTGKTTTLNAIIEIFTRKNADVVLTAPTGRAAKRMTELTGYDAKTIHRLLGVEPGDDNTRKFSHNEANPIKADVLIVDEVSMLDSLLFESLLKALPLNCRLILVGDTNQLPSIGAGNVLGDIIDSGHFNVMHLDTVFRQAKQSSIITTAHAIINGQECDFSNKSSDYFFLQKAYSNDTIDTVLSLCAERLPKTYNVDPIKNIQIICPSKKQDTGTHNLNNLLQACLNPQLNKDQLAYKDVYYREGDKVMQTKNNYDIEWVKDDGERGYGVYNGDVGYIVSITKGVGKMTVRYDDKTVEYTREMLDEIDLAYAVTVHKSQGSEFEIVIIPLFNVPSKLRFRNLLYTAVTRAKKMLIIVGDKLVFNNMEANDKKTLRYTMLKHFITAYEDI
ncbi:MAG: ATP-dependent RecD-like DNA helicase [Clostridia bacterium]|nr:ATP-dependent RecD-like DNA helicase [Clostridia bacterium]